MNLRIPSSVILFRINFNVFTFLLSFIISRICKITASPNSALVRSTVSNESAIIPYITFSYFSGTFIFFAFLFELLWILIWLGAYFIKHFSFSLGLGGIFLLIKGRVVFYLWWGYLWFRWWFSCTLTKLWSSILDPISEPASECISYSQASSKLSSL